MRSRVWLTVIPPEDHDRFIVYELELADFAVFEVEGCDGRASCGADAAD
jgi:hypothetical protein